MSGTRMKCRLDNGPGAGQVQELPYLPPRMMLPVSGKGGVIDVIYTYHSTDPDGVHHYRTDEQ